MNLTPIRVLLVEDDEDDYLLLRDLLFDIKEQQFELEWVPIYEEALELIHRHYDIYLIDYRLGAHTGLELVVEIEKLKGEVPIILLSGQGSRDLDMQAIAAGATDYLNKDDLHSSLLEHYIRIAIERNRATAALRDSEARLRQLFENTSDAIQSIAPDGSFLYVNPAWENLLGYDRHDRENLSVFDIVHLENKGEYRELFDRVMQGQNIDKFEIKYMDKNGSAIIVEGSSSCQLQEGSPVATQDIFRDITDRKQAETEQQQFTADLEWLVRQRTEQLWQTNQSLRKEIQERQEAQLLLSERNRILEAIATDIPLPNILDGIARSLESQMNDAVCAILLANPTKTTLYYAANPSFPEGFIRAMSEGVPIAEGFGSCGTAASRGKAVIVADIASDPLWEKDKNLALKYGFHACWSVPIRATSSEILGTVATYYSIPKSPNSNHWTRLQQFVNLAAIAIEFKQDKQALQLSEERFRRAAIDAPFPIVIHAENGEIVQINKVWTELTGYTQADIPTMAEWTELAYGERQDTIRSYIDSLYELNDRVEEGEFEIATKEGNRRIWSFSSAPLGQLADGRRLVISMANDVTDRSLAQQALRESQQRLQAILDNAPTPIFLKDTQGKLLLVNRKFEAIFGLEGDEIIQQTDVALFSQSMVEPLQANDRQIFETKRPMLFEEIIEQSDGIHTYLSVKFPLFDDSGNVTTIGGIATDISDRLAAQHALEIRAQQQAAIADLGQQALAGLKLSALFDEATVAIASRLNVEYCKVLELLPDGNALLLRSGVGWHEGIVGSATVGAKENSQAGYTLLVNEPVVVEDLQAETRFQGPSLLLDHHVVSGISVMIPNRDRPFGILGAHTTRKRQFTPEDITFLQAVANVLATAIERQTSEAERDNLLAELDRERSLFEAVLQQMPAGVGIAEAPSGKPILTNQQVGEILGNPSQFVCFEEYADYQGYDANRQPLPPERWPLARAIYNGEIVRQQEIQYQKEDGSYGYIQANAAPIRDRDDNIIAGVVIVLDITARKRAEAEVQELNQTLEGRVAERTLELEEANEELKAFSYSVSHDLRAPLRAMQGFSIALLEDYSDSFDEIGCEYATRIVRAAERMEGLIEDLLTYSRLSRNEISIQRVELELVLAEVLSLIESDIQQKQALIQIEPPLPMVKGHRSVLVQVLTNLLSNAIKFVPTGVQPTVRLWVELRDGWERLWIADNGIGIAPEHQNRIFRVFERLHGEESYPGTGIGLAIVRKGIDRLGGRVGVESQLGEGSRFWIELPTAEGG